MTLVLTALGLVAVFSSPAHAEVTSYSASDVLVSANSSVTDTVLSSGVLEATDDFSIEGSVTVTPDSPLVFDFLFLISDGLGNSFLGGQIEDVGSTFLASANAGFSLVNAELNTDVFVNTAATAPLTIDFVVSGGDGQPTTVTVSNFEGGSGSGTITTATTPATPLDPSSGFTLSLVNSDGGDFTVDDIDITVIPEPVAATLLGGMALACLARRQRG